MSKLNAREYLEAVENWLGWQDENLSQGLKSPQDAIKLYDYWQSNPDLPEFCDSDFDDDGNKLSKYRKKALGYDPLK